jgi:hypothetical protein
MNSEQERQTCSAPLTAAEKELRVMSVAYDEIK